MTFFNKEPLGPDELPLRGGQAQVVKDSKRREIRLEGPTKQSLEIEYEMKRYRRVAGKLPNPQPGRPRQEQNLRIPRRIHRNDPKDQQIGASILGTSLCRILKARAFWCRPSLIPNMMRYFEVE